MQSPKIIDVSRSFVPINPNAYPENMHGTEREDFPEKRVPIVPYIGANFLPTFNGYKSYFGINRKLDVDTLAPNKPDYVFLFQSLTFQNFLVALCDTGIWYKSGTIQGPWVQAVVSPAVAANVYLEWTFTTIKNVLYVFRSNGEVFHEIKTSLVAPGITFTPRTPNFITPSAQLGLCRINNRIGFWDAQNALAWSSPDDYTNFTPNVLDGTNVTTFNSIIGKISAIRPHGTNAIVYASKSVVLLQIEPSQTFLIKARPLLDNVGVPYSRQSVEGVPNTTHFCYGSNGIYKIEDNKPELIIPEIFDYFKDFTPAPIYMKLLEGRYLAFELTDPEAVAGVPQFSQGFIAEGSVTFAGARGTLLAASDLASFNMCSVSDFGQFNEPQADAAVRVPPSSQRLPGSKVTPVYTCYIANNGVKDPANIVWQATPCATLDPNGVDVLMNPGGLDITKLTQTTANKRAVTDAQAYVDGWTITRFVQTQMAIWQAEEKALKAFNAAAVNRAKSVSKNNLSSVSSPSALVSADCNIGTYPDSFSAPRFGFSRCSFWLTRFCTSKFDLVRTKTNQTVALIDSYDTAAAIAAANSQGQTFVTNANADNAACLALGTAPGNCGSNNPQYTIEESVNTAGTPRFRFVGTAVGPASTGSVVTTTFGPYNEATIVYNNKETMNAFNKRVNTQVGIFANESAFCEITGWKYKNLAGATVTVPAAACTAPTISPNPTTNPGLKPGGVVPDVAKDTGSSCGLSYDPAPVDAVTLNWPDQTVIYPAGTFLLQEGSIAPRYPTFKGAFVYDMHLKKWGKLVHDYKQLLDYSPINSSSTAPVNFATFGIMAGLVKEDGFVYLFDEEPSVSFLTWGKVGYYREGVTDIQEIRFDFTKMCSGSINIDVSLDNSSVLAALRHTQTYNNVKQATVFPPYSGKWFNVTLSGNFDINLIEVKMLKKGRR